MNSSLIHSLYPLSHCCSDGIIEKRACWRTASRVINLTLLRLDCSVCAPARACVCVCNAERERVRDSECLCVTTLNVAGSPRLLWNTGLWWRCSVRRAEEIKINRCGTFEQWWVRNVKNKVMQIMNIWDKIPAREKLKRNEEHDMCARQVRRQITAADGSVKTIKQWNSLKFPDSTAMTSCLLLYPSLQQHPVDTD